MTAVLHICRACDEPITDPDDAVYLGHKEAMSGPGWDVWAHRDHAELVVPDPAPIRMLARILIHHDTRQPKTPGGTSCPRPPNARPTPIGPAEDRRP